MPTWCKAVLRTIGALNAILSIFGLYLLVDPISRGLFRLNANAESPYFRIALVSMTVTNTVLLLLFFLASVQLLRLKKAGVTIHTIGSAMLVAYDVLIGMFWAAGGPVGMSVGAATGVGNLGIAPFQCFNLAPYVYPIASTVLLLVTHQKVATTLQTSAGIAAVSAPKGR
jgi:hypothetical protein